MNIPLKPSFPTFSGVNFMDYSIPLEKYEGKIEKDHDYIVVKNDALEVVEGDVLLELLGNGEDILVVCKLEEEIFSLGGSQHSLSIWKGDDGNYYAIFSAGHYLSKVIGQYDFLSVSSNFLRKKAFEALGIPEGDMDGEADG